MFLFQNSCFSNYDLHTETGRERETQTDRQTERQTDRFLYSVWVGENDVELSSTCADCLYSE